MTAVLGWVLLGVWILTLAAAAALAHQLAELRNERAELLERLNATWERIHNRP